ncbi:FtsX-like permease family protein [Marinoscillum pacificum]|uniref:FtsX-like permease family protein n=1 Tax=Marinoscillum pacificum TaxID=392723 RepID=UPI0021589A42|nr:FtsX-like permease family protein [Marinoscillum pacificum]
MINPPKWPERVLSRFCRPDLADEIIGDLHEAFMWRAETEGERKARRKYVLEAIGSLKPSNLKSIYQLRLNNMIFTNYLKIAFRNLQKRKTFSAINIFGLASGVAAFILISLYAFQILMHDSFFENKDQIYLAYKERITPDGTQPTYDTWVPMRNKLVETYPEITNGTKTFAAEAKVVKGSQFINEELLYTDEHFFEVFNFKLLHGSASKPFQDKSSVILSKELALKHFGKENALGEELELYLPEEDTTKRYLVSGVIDDYPANISIRPQMVLQMSSIPAYPDFVNNWGSSFIETFIVSRSNPEELEAAFPDLVESLWDKEARNNTNFKLLPYSEYYNTFLGDQSTASTLLYIGLGILLIAIINFMNLSTAHASQRSKEIGLRKVLGAYQGQLKTQFMAEATVMSTIATLIGVTIVLITLPYFNHLFDVAISIDLLGWTPFAGGIAVLIVLLAVLSGSYPAFYLSSIRVLDVLKQRLSFGKSANLRNVLVIVQFTIAVILISATLLVKNQIMYMSDKNMGFDSEETLIISASARDFTNREEGITRLNTFKNELKNKSYIKDLSISRSVPTEWSRSFTFVKPDGWNGNPLRMSYTYVDANFLDTYGITLKSGNSFLADSEGDQRTSVILNEAAMKAFEFETDANNVIKIGDHRINVIGIVEDFHFESLQNKIEPTLIFHRTAQHPVHRFISCKIDMTNIDSELSEIADMWSELGATTNFNYTFLDDRIKQLYESEARFLGLISLFSVISIIIACMGLYGLTLFIIQKRQKELSIRKVLGAEISGLLQLIFKEFALWIGAAFIIGVPLVVYFINQWVSDFYYQSEFSWFTIVETLIIMCALVILTVGYQSLKATKANPVNYLKDE